MAFRFWVDDWDGGTSYMTNEEAGAYIRLLIYQFRNGSIPPIIFNRITSGLTTVEQVLAKFELIDGNYVQHRMALVRKDTIVFAEKQSLKGKKSAQQRFNRGSTVVEPSGSGSGSGSGNGNEDREKGVVGEKGKEPNLPELHTQKYYEQSLDDDVWQAQVCRSTKKEPYQIPKLLEQFNADMLARQEYHPTIRDYRSHFVNWVKKSETETKKNKKSNAPLTIEHIASVVEQAKHIRVTLGNFDSPREDQVP